jgi:hypothetical protein
MVLIGFGLAQPREAFGQQRRAGQAEPAGAVAAGAMLLVERRGVGCGGGKCCTVPAVPKPHVQHCGCWKERLAKSCLMLWIIPGQKSGDTQQEA